MKFWPPSHDSSDDATGMTSSHHLVTCRTYNPHPPVAPSERTFNHDPYTYAVEAGN